MKSLLTLGFISFAMTFCGLQERLGLGGNSATNAPPSNSSATTGSTTIKGEPAQPSAAQQAIIDQATETKWDEQGISWKLPASWKKMSDSNVGFNYTSPDNAFLLVNISNLGENFPIDISLNAYHEQALEQLKNGKYLSVKMTEIDGIPGVEFVEAPPKGKDDPRRHQWISYRRYLGQTQQLNVMTSTRSSNFDKHSDTFAAILYSMKAVK